MTIDEFIELARGEPDEVATALRRLHAWIAAFPTIHERKKRTILWLQVRVRSEPIVLFHAYPNQGMYVRLDLLSQADRAALRAALTTLDPAFASASPKRPTFDIRTVASDGGWGRFATAVDAIADPA